MSTYPKYIYFPDFVRDCADTEFTKTFYMEDHSKTSEMCSEMGVRVLSHYQCNCNYNPELWFKVPNMESLRKFSESLFPGAEIESVSDSQFISLEWCSDGFSDKRVVKFKWVADELAEEENYSEEAKKYDNNFGEFDNTAIQITVTEDGEMCTLNLWEYVEQFETAFPDGARVVSESEISFGKPYSVILYTSEPFIDITQKMVSDMLFNTEICDWVEEDTELYDLLDTALHNYEDLTNEKCLRLWELWKENSENTVEIKLIGKE